MLPKNSRNRSRRLRKKLKLDEFRELCFEFKLTGNITEERLDKLTDDIIDMVENAGLSTCLSSRHLKDGKSVFIGYVTGAGCKGCHLNHVPGREPTERDIMDFKQFIFTFYTELSLEYFSDLRDANYSFED